MRLHILYRQGGRLSLDGLMADATAAARAKRVAEQAARLHSALLHVRAAQQVLKPSPHGIWSVSM